MHFKQVFPSEDCLLRKVNLKAWKARVKRAFTYNRYQNTNVT